MSLPTPEQQAAAAAALVPHTQAQLNILGLPITVDVSQVQAVLQVAVDALCMQAWRAAQAKGKAAADTLTTEVDAERAQRQP